MGGACGAGGGASVDAFLALPSTLRPLPENGFTLGLVSCAFLAARSAASLAKSNVPIFSFSGVPSAPLRFPVVCPAANVEGDEEEEEADDAEEEVAAEEEIEEEEEDASVSATGFFFHFASSSAQLGGASKSTWQSVSMIEHALAGFKSFTSMLYFMLSYVIVI